MRTNEPVTVGVPLPRGAALAATNLHVETAQGAPALLQVRPLDLWPDGSIRWVLLDFFADTEPGRSTEYVLRIGPPAAHGLAGDLQTAEMPGRVEITTSAAIFEFVVGGAFPFSRVAVGEQEPVRAEGSGFRVEHDGRVIEFDVDEVRVCVAGPVRAEIELRARPRASSGPVALDVSARVEVFSGTGTARVHLTLRNRRRATHPSNQWVLGDAGSLFLRSAVMTFEMANRVDRVWCAPETGDPIAEVQLPFEIYQESSGGDHWDGPIHRNREGRVPVRFCGYRLQSGSEERQARRASPVVALDAAFDRFAVAVPDFWENCPRAIAVAASTVEIGLFPRQFDDVYELQGGEQKTHTFVVAFAGDAVSNPELAWCHDPTVLYPSPEWCCATGAVPFLMPVIRDTNDRHATLLEIGLDPVDGFFNKRELADEYGWRNFGDLHADHESAFQPVDRPFVSHYNNQYDPMAGFAVQFLRTGDPRWRQLMIDLARHVRDIDIYHTTEDKSAYSGGLFWHTYHYADAGTSTHRSYPRELAAGGGPSAEHNYNAGLMLHYFMTGESASREAAIGLGRWVLEMDDGSRTVFRWLAGGATGLASATLSPDYHGPGRGPANSILACLVAHRLTGDSSYVRKADELVRRCIHPHDDVEGRQLLDVERRWHYTVFLQALGTYLHQKEERGEFDEMYGYAQESLLRYARWMAVHERPYLDHPEVLEFPTETWAAQDMRKAEVFWWAALHSEGAERRLFIERAGVFFHYAIDTLESMPGRRFSRPLVLILANGPRHAWFGKHGGELPPPRIAPIAAAALVSFEPQRVRALRRAIWLAAGLAVSALAALAITWLR